MLRHIKLSKEDVRRLRFLSKQYGLSLSETITFLIANDFHMYEYDEKKGCKKHETSF